MDSENSNTRDLLLEDVVASLDRLGTEEWVTVYDYSSNQSETIGRFCAILSPKIAARVLSNSSWDLLIGHNNPGISYHYGRRKQKTWQYSRNLEKGIEPLVNLREFHGMRPDYVEVSEDFRLYFNLHDDRTQNHLLLIDDDGDEEVVVRWSGKRVEIKLRLLKEYISVRRMRLALYFEVTRFSPSSLADLGIKPYERTERAADRAYSILANQGSALKHDHSSFGRITGKKIVSGIPKFTPDFLGRHPDREYMEFSIGVDEHGREMLHTCDEEKLANYFGKNPGAPHFLTPVLFRREVLTKYYSQPQKYSVEDGYLRCGVLWGLRMDNNQDDVVMVYLGDLGRLSFKQQHHWRSFNITGKGRLSHTAFKRGIEAQFADPERSDLYFKQRLEMFREAWRQRFGWDLFLPLRAGDEHHLISLHIPVANEQKEFDEQVLSLTKILIDSLNEKELARGLNLAKDAKGLAKLEAFMESKALKFPGMIDFLRSLQSLRSTGTAHRKGDPYEKTKAAFGIGSKDLREVYDEILVSCIKTLNTLQSHLVAAPPASPEKSKPQAD